MKNFTETGEISFRPLSFVDIRLIHHWFNLPHVQEFYSLRQWTEQEVLKKLRPYITGEKSISAFIVLLDGVPIGYVQFYKVKDYPWEKQDLPENIILQWYGYVYW